MTIDPDDPMWFPSGENPPLEPLLVLSPDHVSEIPKNEHVPHLVLTGDPMLDRLRARGMHTEAAEIARLRQQVADTAANVRLALLEIKLLRPEIKRLRQQLADARTILNTAPAQTWVQALRNKLEE